MGWVSFHGHQERGVFSQPKHRGPFTLQIQSYRLPQVMYCLVNRFSLRIGVKSFVVCHPTGPPRVRNCGVRRVFPIAVIHLRRQDIGRTELGADVGLLIKRPRTLEGWRQ